MTRLVKTILQFVYLMIRNIEMISKSDEEEHIV